ncbi:RNA editing associated helicase 2 [Strigomonas culicis]|uniref:RNA helicase n=1 Tax=Strigomonas culicis TaxID=28005 RepID=S9TS25_9TRYP|nr:RNA editing associated helicase 2 [Strigomonas culicis]|eukprot:EPY19313.1 RNA editing associated helicase 2 [Strigomonas culicis]
MYHTAKMQLPLRPPKDAAPTDPARGATAEACGVAMTKREAETLCWMHAERLLDDAGVPLFDNLPGLQRYHARRVQQLGRAAPTTADEAAPRRQPGQRAPVLPLRLVVSTPMKVAKPEPPGDAAAEVAWSAYTEACSRYIVHKRMEGNNLYFDVERSPRTGIAFVDAALDEAEQQGSVEAEGAKLLLQLYCNAAGTLYPNAWRSHLVGPLTHRVHYTTIVVPGFPQVLAYGVGATKERAQRRAALHALAVLRRVDPDYAQHYEEAVARRDSVKTQSAPGEVDTDAEGLPVVDMGDATRTGQQARRKSKRFVEPAWDAVRRDFTPLAKVRLVELFTISADTPAPRVRDCVQRTAEVPPKVLYSTEVSVTDDKENVWSCKCDAAGPKSNRAEAYERLFLLLSQNVPLFGTLTEYMKSRPFLHPRHVAALSLSPAVKEEMVRVTETAARQQQQRAEASAEDSAQGSPSHDDTPSETDAGASEASDAEEQLQLQALDAAERAQRSQELLERLHEKITNVTYLENFAKKRQQLSIAAHRREIMDAIAQNPVVVICGTTGCGKTTQIPQYILDDYTENGKGGDCSIVVTQPRRISAVSIAKRVAAERLEPLSESCGYSIRFDTRLGKHINFCTSGILLRMLRRAPQLDHITHLIIDEIHERDINSDFLLILLRDLIKVRANLRVVLMSATLQADQFSAFFGGAPLINVEGYVHPVKEYYLEDLSAMAEERQVSTTWLREAARLSSAEAEQEGSTSVDDWLAKDFSALRPKQKQLYAVKETQNEIDYATVLFAIEQANHLVDLRGSSILVFLPGWEEIVRTREMLERHARYHIICLHSSVSPEEQMQCFFPAPDGKLKVVLSTNIAESGVTIDDVGAVVDVGRAKEKSYSRRSSHTGVGQEEASRLSRLMTVYASRANCVQRRGRVGRTRPGVCLRLYTKKHFDELHEFQTPEMMRTPLDSLCLQILSLRLGDPRQFLTHALEPPRAEDVEAALSRLAELGALTAAHALTPLGERLAVLPTEPQCGKMILMGAIFRCLDAALTIAATCSQVDVFQNSRDAREAARLHREDLSCQTQSDLIASLNGYNLWAAARAQLPPGELTRRLGERVLSVPQLMLVSRCKRQFFELLCDSGFLPKYVARMYASDPRGRYGDRVDEQAAPAAAGQEEAEKAFVEVSSFSAESLSVPLVKSVIAAGLLPHVAMHHGKRVMRSKLEDFIYVSTDSVLYRTATSAIGQPYYTYTELFLSADTRRLSVRGVSSMSLWTLILFLHDVDDTRIQHHIELGLVVIDEWILLHLSIADLKCVQSFKAAFNQCVNHKFALPHDVENNALLQRMCTVIQTLAGERIIPNKLVTEEEAWEERGMILSPKKNLPDSILHTKEATPRQEDGATREKVEDE